MPTLNRGLFWVDAITTFPIDGIAALALGIHQRNENVTSMCLGLVRWLRLARLYRIFIFFSQLEHAMIVSQATLVLTRDLFYVFCSTHWAACLLFWVAQMEEMLGMPSWKTRSPERWDDDALNQ
jgi:hypothetical protein